MQFLKTLFWVVLSILLVLFATENWTPVTIRLWGGLEVDIKLPVLLIGVFLLGFLPTFIIHRARIWSFRRKLDVREQDAAETQTAAAAHETDEPPATARSEHVAADSNMWPSA